MQVLPEAPAQGHIFMSYARDDSTYVDGLVSYLKQEGLVVWTDRAELQPGDPRWQQTIVSAINDCAAMVVVMTPAAEGSEFVPLEIAQAMKKGKQILPLLLNGEAFFILGTTQFEDVTETQMPSERFVQRLRHLSSQVEAVTDEGSRYMSAEDWSDEAVRLGNLNRWEESLTAIDRSIRLEPDNANSHSRRALALTILGLPGEVLTAADRATQLDPRLISPYNLRSWALRMLGRPREALQARDQGLAIEASRSTSYAISRDAMLTEAFERAAAREPSRATFRNQLGWLRLLQGHEEVALASFDKAVQLDPGYAAAHRNRGFALSRLGDLEQASSAYELAIELDPRLV